ncbi:endo alpha-1,4 polygalactosaminidase [Kallotenue papyrolyticum]|uniref:endo alpha-1,4 polygalactosaminidase n=1 Tax=Kallotenue papyrolyticum TaxID=1325125 RepID=UPI0004B4F722|nr:endo alpha-1,4 polygalactosaminidase [Kallotenue papyrolyticum]
MLLGVIVLGGLALGGALLPSGRPAPPTPSPTAAPDWWRPAPGVTWQWQLNGPLDLSIVAQMYDIDLFDSDPAQIAALRQQGRIVICYLNAGAWEAWRPDAASFPAALLGAPLEGWPDERWLDIRRLDLLAPLIEARLDLCRAKGFHGVEADNVDAYANHSGFPLTAADQLAYNRWLAAAAHARGLSIGLKNDLEQIPQLVDSFDWALNEQCFEYDECDALLPFIAAGKAVFHVEYHLEPETFCPQAQQRGFSSLHKRPTLDSYRAACWEQPSVSRSSVR